MQKERRAVFLANALWPRWWAVGRALRWAGLALIVGLLAGLASPRALPDPASLHPFHLLAAGLLGAFLLGAWRVRFDRQTIRRISDTHVDLAGARSPVGWIFTALLAAASLGVGWGFGRDASPSSIIETAGASLALVVGALVACLVGALASGYLSARQIAEGKQEPRAYFTDHPIGPDDDDLLERGPLVDVLVRAVTELRDGAPGFVSLEGAWGTGKSSVVALARSRLLSEGHISAEFSGYHYATTDRLVDALALTIERALNARFASLDPGRDFRSFYRTFRPVLDGPLPFGLPDLSDARPDAKDRLESLLAPVAKPVAVFLEDLDRLRGEDLLRLLGAVQLIGSIRGFVFVLVIDRDRCAQQLQGLVPEPSEYLRKSINATIPLPRPPAYVLYEEFERMLGDIEKVRKVSLTAPRNSALTPDDWVAAAPTLRHMKQLVNSYSTAMALLAGEIDPFDALLATALDEFAPGVLDAIEKDPEHWLTSIHRTPQEAVRSAIRRERENARQGRENHPATKLVAADYPELQPLLAALFDMNRSPMEDDAGQHIACFEYFRRYRERLVRKASVPDKNVETLVEEINNAEPTAAAGVAEHRLLEAPNRLVLLNKLIVRSYLFTATAGLPVIVALARVSDRLARPSHFFEPDESERARALIFVLLEQGKGDHQWQRQAMVDAITWSGSLSFARALVLYASPDRNHILTDFDAFDENDMKSVLADVVRGRLERGYDPFRAEPEDAPWIIAALNDPVVAAEWVVKLGAVRALLEAIRPYGQMGIRLDAINWESLAPFDREVLCKGLPSDGLSDLEELLIAGPPGDPKPAESDDDHAA